MMFDLVWRPAQDMPALATAPFDVWREDDGSASTEFHRIPEGFLLRFVDGGDYAIDLAARTVTCTPLPDVPEDYVENIFAHQVQPMLSTYLGTTVLHASCVAIDGGAYGFLGRSGRGKSTLAAAFARNGHAFLTDDGMVLDRGEGALRIQPYLPSIRLLPDSQEALLGKEQLPGSEDDWPAKVRVPADERIPHCPTPAPLRAIYVLEEPAAEDTIITPLPEIEAISALLQHSFLLDSHDRLRVAKHFRTMAELARAIPVFTLDYPRDYARLPAVIAAIADHARAIGARAEARTEGTMPCN
ncbi:MAG: hypothetical protein ACK4G2_05010 [Novosphingobium sp.]